MLNVLLGTWPINSPNVSLDFLLKFIEKVIKSGLEGNKLIAIALTG